MVFSSIVFLFLFLPLVLFGYYILPKKIKSYFLLTASLLFYLWGETQFFFVIVLSILINYGFSLLISQKSLQKYKKSILIFSIIGNLSLLIYFKYSKFILESFGIENTGFLNINEIYLPLGISFFTFQALSYVIDVYKGTNPVQKNPFKLGLYIAMFPQLIAGPIVRYHDIAKQIENRTHKLSLFISGVEKFIIGLGKKVLIANTVAESADYIFALPAETLSTSHIWIAVLCYTIQIYFDFSGYSDMAIGLGRMFGFKLLENFNYPYISKSIREFWRRWHISLSNWLKDYLYIPLGGSRVSKPRIYFNIFTVFLLCGLWHGAGWNFILWGCWYAVFLMLERLTNFENIKAKRWIPFKHLYTLAVVVLGWVLFRAESIDKAILYYKKMFTYTANEFYPMRIFLDNEIILAIVLGIIFSTPLISYLGRKMKKEKHPIAASIITKATCVFILLLSIGSLATDAYNPFIYFRF